MKFAPFGYNAIDLYYKCKRACTVCNITFSVNCVAEGDYSFITSFLVVVAFIPVIMLLQRYKIVGWYKINREIALSNLSIYLIGNLGEFFGGKL